MKKTVLFLSLLIAVPAIAFASFQPATLTNGVNKVAVFSQEQANKYFSMGYELATDKVGNMKNMFRSYFYKGVTVGGAIGTANVGASYTLTPSQVCDNSSLFLTPTGTAATVTLPATSTAMFTQCLPRVGDFLDINYKSVATSSTIAAGAGGTLGYTSAASVAANKYAIIRILRTATATYNAYVINIAN